MHSIVRQNEHEWIVARYEVDNGTTSCYPIFHKLSMASAIKIASYLNGGGQNLSEMELKVLPMCAC
jgi:hypothetical protein